MATKAEMQTEILSLRGKVASISKQRLRAEREKDEQKERADRWYSWWRKSEAKHHGTRTCKNCSFKWYRSEKPHCIKHDIIMTSVEGICADWAR